MSKLSFETLRIRFNSTRKSSQISDCNVPDGKYKVVVSEVNLSESKNGVPQFCWKLEILEGEFAGCHLYRYNTLNGSEKSFELLVSDLKIFHYTLEDLADLKSDELAGVLIGQRQIVQVVTNEKGQSILFVKKSKKKKKETDSPDCPDCVEPDERKIFDGFSEDESE